VAGNRSFRLIPQFSSITLLILVQIWAAVGIKAQSAPAEVQPSSGSVQPNSGPTAEEIQRRLERARALAAAHQLSAAAGELEYVRSLSAGDLALRDGTSVMLMGIYLEDGNYSRAQSLLEETFQARSNGSDSSIRSYFALAGQAVNGIRLHLARYRNFGVSVGSATLPAEAVSDIDRIRLMLERLVAQAKEITKGAPAANDGLALLEDVLGIRTSLARDAEDRDKWQAEYAAARQQLGSARIQIASIGKAPSLVTPTPSPAQPPAPAATDTNPKSTVTPAPQTSNDNPAEERPKFLGLLNGRATKRVVPQYPQIAKMQGTQGVVKVNVTVNEAGAIQVVNSEGPTLLRQAAEDAARGWQFPPFIVEGKPIRLAGYLEFTFNLK
jgi:TonB family protein